MPHCNIPLSAPAISEEDIAAVVSVLRTPHLSLGPKLPEFEKAIAAFVGTKHAVAVSSGTAALHLCVRALKIKDGDEVITTPFSFVASSNCMLFERAVPVFVDIEPKTYGIDPEKIERAITRKTKAILAVDVFGFLADWDALRAIAKKHDLLLIEDSCEALGTSRNGKMAGTFGDVGTFAFYPNKQMTTGEGGMVVTNREEIATSARMMRNQGRSLDSSWLEHKILGFNYRLSDLNCALGVSQLKKLPSLIERRRRVVEWYRESLSPLGDAIAAPSDQDATHVSWFVFPAKLHERFAGETRDRLLMYLRSHGVGCNNYFPPIHLQPLYRAMGHREGDFPLAEGISRRMLALPFFSDLTREEVATVCDVLKDGMLTL